MNISLPIQNFIRTFSLFMFMLSYTLSVTGQTVVGVIDYMKVNNPEEYLELEKEWKKVHKERLEQGMIIGWAMYEVMFKTIEDPYNYITVSWYDSFSKLDKGIPQSVIEVAMPNMSEEEWKLFNEKTNKSRIIISERVFHQRFTCADKNLDRGGLFYVINEMIVKPGQSKELLQIYEKIYKPIFEEDIRNNNRTNWSFWEKWPGNTKDFQYLSADGYTDPNQIDHSKFLLYFNQIHPDKDADKISKRMESLRTLINTEMWKLIYRVVN